MRSGKELHRVKPGDPYRHEDQNDLVDAAEAINRFFVAGGHGLNLPSGAIVSAPSDEWVYARIDAVDGDGAATWQELQPEVGGTFSGGARSGSPGSDPAYEANGQTPVSFPVNVIMRRSVTSGQWLYFADRCS